MAGLDKPRVILLGGATACGKTVLPVQMARKLGAEIVFETTVMEAGKPCRVVHLKVSSEK